MRKKPHDKILRKEPKKQHLSIVHKSCYIIIMCSNICRNQLQVYYFFSQKKKNTSRISHVIRNRVNKDSFKGKLQQYEAS